METYEERIWQLEKNILEARDGIRELTDLSREIESDVISNHQNLHSNLQDLSNGVVSTIVFSVVLVTAATITCSAIVIAVTISVLKK